MALPVSPGVPGMASPDPNEYEQNVSKWDQFLQQLTSPGIGNTLLTTGLNMMQNKQVGESDLSHAAGAVGKGLKSYEEGKQRQFRDQQALGVADRDQQRVDLQRGGLGVDQGRLAETSRSNMEQEKIARERIAASKQYYASLTAQARSSDALRRNDALQRAFDVEKLKLETLQGQLEMMKPTDPRAIELQNQIQAGLQNMAQMLSDTAGQFAGQQAPPRTRDEADAWARVQPWFNNPEARAAYEADRNARFGSPAAAPTGSPTPSAPASPTPAAAAAKDKPASTSEVRSKFARNKAAWSSRVSGEEAQRALEWLQGNMVDLTNEQQIEAERLIEILRNK